VRAYRNAWQASVAVLTAVALVAAGSSIGWPALLCAVGAVAVGGATCGFAWVDEPPRRSRAIGYLAVSFAVAGVLVLGLPTLLGSWSVLVLAALLTSSPLVVEWLVGRRRLRHQVRTPEQARSLRERDLELRWLRTSRDVRERGADVVAVLALVQERALLLDELERRDPERLDDLLVRAGWREPQDR
jgi:hypothetical protein